MYLYCLVTFRVAVSSGGDQPAGDEETEMTACAEASFHWLQRNVLVAALPRCPPLAAGIPDMPWVAPRCTTEHKTTPRQLESNSMMTNGWNGSVMSL